MSYFKWTVIYVPIPLLPFHFITILCMQIYLLSLSSWSSFVLLHSCPMYLTFYLSGPMWKKQTSSDRSFLNKYAYYWRIFNDIFKPVFSACVLMSSLEFCLWKSCHVAVAILSTQWHWSLWNRLCIYIYPHHILRANETANSANVYACMCSNIEWIALQLKTIKHRCKDTFLCMHMSSCLATLEKEIKTITKVL